MVHDKFRQQKAMDCAIERSKIQVLYDACDAVFSQKELPTFQQIQWLKNLLDLMEAIDVGIDEFSLHQSPYSSPKIIKGLVCGQAVSEITYIHIHECDNFSMGVFCFPAGGTLPLHDHPNMTVLSKLLYGSVHVKAYDWVKVENSSCRTRVGRNSHLFTIVNPQRHIDICYLDERLSFPRQILWERGEIIMELVGAVGLAGIVTNSIFKAPREPSILFPRSGGNIHSFTALTPCAILDVLAPPYSEEFGRPSTYFYDMPIPTLPGYVILEERDLPDNLVVTRAPYLGPSIAAGNELITCL